MNSIKPIGSLIVIALVLCTVNYAWANEIEKQFVKAGLVDVNTIDSSIKVDLVNSTPEKNYFREDFYYGLQKAYLRREVGIKLSKAQKILKEKHRDYSLLVSDAARPRSVHRKCMIR